MQCYLRRRFSNASTFRKQENNYKNSGALQGRIVCELSFATIPPMRVKRLNEPLFF